MSNKDLLKQAIAEAKTIREAAIANAKEALEESLTPHLKEMLALKLQEMEELEENMEEDATINAAGFEDYSENPETHGNVRRVDEEAEEEEEEETEEAPEEEEEAEETEEEEVEIEDMSVEDLKELIRDIVSQELDQEEGKEMAPEGEEMVGIEDEEEININEILAELEEENLTEKKHEQKEMNELVGGDPVSLELGLQTLAAGAGVILTLAKAVPAIMDMAKEGKFGDKIKAAAMGLEKTGTLAGGITQQKANIEDMDEDLNEALATVSQLRTQLQEVNLLNAKLLYVNKVFKANNLTESQKVNVVTAFDKAETVKEVKLVYETVSKNVSTNTTPKQAIKEHKSFASRPAGTTQKQVINEVSEAVKRMQILAGIRDREI